MSAGFLSPCHGAPVHINMSGSGPATTGYYVCEACGQPCDPMPREVRDRLVAEGMRRAARLAEVALSVWSQNCDRPSNEHSGPSYAAAVAGEAASRDIATAIRREAERLAPKRRDIPTSPDNQEATDGRESTT